MLNSRDGTQRTSLKGIYGGRLQPTEPCFFLGFGLPDRRTLGQMTRSGLRGASRPSMADRFTRR